MVEEQLQADRAPDRVAGIEVRRRGRVGADGTVDRREDGRGQVAEAEVRARCGAQPVAREVPADDVEFAELRGDRAPQAVDAGAQRGSDNRRVQELG
nr:hypothetical protein [Nocardioides gansuensis]